MTNLTFERVKTGQERGIFDAGQALTVGVNRQRGAEGRDDRSGIIVKRDLDTAMTFKGVKEDGATIVADRWWYDEANDLMERAPQIEIHLGALSDPSEVPADLKILTTPVWDSDDFVVTQGNYEYKNYMRNGALYTGQRYSMEEEDPWEDPGDDPWEDPGDDPEGGGEGGEGGEGGDPDDP